MMPGHVLNKYRPGVSGVSWKCQRRACSRIVPRSEIACVDHKAMLSAVTLMLAESTADLEPTHTHRRDVLLTADHEWRHAA